MATRAVTTFYQRREILHRKRVNQTLRQIATEMGLKEDCVRKWWRIGRDEGEQVLQRSLGRPAKGGCPPSTPGCASCQPNGASKGVVGVQAKHASN